MGEPTRRAVRWAALSAAVSVLLCTEVNGALAGYIGEATPTLPSTLSPTLDRKRLAAAGLAGRYSTVPPEDRAIAPPAAGPPRADGTHSLQTASIFAVFGSIIFAGLFSMWDRRLPSLGGWAQLHSADVWERSPLDPRPNLNASAAAFALGAALTSSEPNMAMAATGTMTSTTIQQGTIVAGQARVVDGDTLVVTAKDGTTTRVRMMGIDAPESKQVCSDAKGQDYACGAASRDYLQQLVGDAPVECFASKVDLYGRVLGVCFDPSSGKDLNKAMVDAGQAVAYKQYSKAYVDDEDTARAARQGLWAGQFQVPAEYRKERRAAAQARREQSPAGPAVAVSAPAPPEELPNPKLDLSVKGQARTVDGDTLVITDALGQQTRVRLLGIDAPESKQICTDASGAPYACGQESKQYLAGLIGDHQVECFAGQRDQYSRLVGLCFDATTKKELNQAMVEAGEAVAYRQFSKAYVDEEEAAHRAGKGIWRGTFEAPAEYRRAVRAGAPAVP
eukprot:EG_transcript_7295